MKKQLHHGKTYALLSKYVGKNSLYAEILLVVFALSVGIYQYNLDVILREWGSAMLIALVLLFLTYMVAPHELIHALPLWLFGGKVKIIARNKILGIPIYNLTIEETQHRYSKWQYAISFILPTITFIVFYLVGITYCIKLTNNCLFLLLLPICIKGCTSDISYFVEILQSASKKFFMTVDTSIAHYGEL